METAELFKTCPNCKAAWNDRESFLADPLISLNGYQFNLKSVENGLFLFTHLSTNCRTTMAVPVSWFLDLYSGPRYPESRALSPECPRFCIDEKNLERCQAICECAFVREVMQVIRQAAKQS